MDYPIDFVITYVNASDRKWRELYINVLRLKNKQFVSNSARFRDWGTLRYIFRGVAQYMPWIRNVYLVVQSESQVPDWVNRNKVNIITHEQIIPRKFLPTYNSDTIELFLYCIPGLSEHFLYANDDMFPIGNMQPSDFYDENNNPKISIKYDKLFNNDYRKICKTTEIFCCKHLNKKISKPNRVLHTDHNINGMLRSTWEMLWDNYGNELEKTITTFREPKNISQELFNYWHYLSGQYSESTRNTKYSNLNINRISKIQQILSDANTQLVCLNDAKVISFKETQKQINFLFKLLFKNYCVYENEYINESNIKVALCAIAKNENNYIREWVEHYKKIGIAKIFLYDNNDIDGEHFEDVINDYIQKGFVEVIDKRGVEKGVVYNSQGINLQTQCYIECYEQKCNEFDWVAFFDIDEFLVLKNDITLKQFLSSNKFNAFDTILVPWEHYDDNNLLYYDSRTVMKRFTHKSNSKHYGVKSIARTNMQICDKTQKNLIHFFRINCGTAIITNGEIIDNTYNLNWITRKRPLSGANAILNHYKTKTLEEFVNRHLGRHWGTTTQHTIKARNYYDIIYDFFKYNSWNNEKAYFLHKELNYNAIISLTSWKKRINTVHLTINNLKTMCGDKYKIVLTLSIDEFPNKENDLPQSLLDTNIEIIWVQRDYGCYKKVLFAMQKYPNIPIISADDDCLYKYNYADELYNKWLKTPHKIITLFKENSYKINDTTYKFSYGRGTLFPPSSILRLLPYIEDNEILERCNDDSLYGIYCNKENIKIIYLNHTYEDVLCFSTNNDSLTYELLHTNINIAQKKFTEDKKIFVNKLICNQ